VKFFAAIASLAALGFLASDTFASSTADRAFAALVDQYLNERIEFSPVEATAIGDHRADNRLDEVDARARQRERDAFRAYRDALAAIDQDELSRANQVDAEILRNEIDSTLFEFDTLEEWAWNPLLYIDRSGRSIYGLLARDFAPVEQRLDNAAARLEQLPRFLEQARAALQPERVAFQRFTLRRPYNRIQGF
jgi:uncharacterized protein (DUF885 family)